MQITQGLRCDKQLEAISQVNSRKNNKSRKRSAITQAWDYSQAIKTKSKHSPTFTFMKERLLTIWKENHCSFWKFKSQSFHSLWKRKCQSLSHVRLFGTPWTVAHQAPLSMEFSRQEYWNELPFPSPEDPPDPGIEPRCPALQADSLSSKPPRNTPQKSKICIRGRLKTRTLIQTIPFSLQEKERSIFPYTQLFKGHSL